MADGSLLAQPFSTNRKYPSNQHLQYVKDLYSECFDVLDFLDDNGIIVDVLWLSINQWKQTTVYLAWT